MPLRGFGAMASGSSSFFRQPPRILRSPLTPDAHLAHDRAARASPAECRALVPGPLLTAPTRRGPVGGPAPAASPEAVLHLAYRVASVPAQLQMVSAGRSQTTPVQSVHGARPVRALPLH